MTEILKIEELIKTKSYIDRIIDGKYYDFFEMEKFKNYYKSYKKNYKKYKKEIMELQKTKFQKIEYKLLKFNISCYILYKNIKKYLKSKRIKEKLYENCNDRTKKDSF